MTSIAPATKEGSIQCSGCFSCKVSAAANQKKGILTKRASMAKSRANETCCDLTTKGDKAFLVSLPTTSGAPQPVLEATTGVSKESRKSTLSGMTQLGSILPDALTGSFLSISKSSVGSTSST